MDRARAGALLSCQGGAFRDGLAQLDTGIREIATFYEEHGRPDLVAMSQEIAALKDLKTQLREAYDIPLTRDEVLEGLREEQARAIADEDYERAARIRDEIARFQRGESSNST
jgi:excinuclease UvrABC helicase subunit UvrB